MPSYKRREVGYISEFAVILMEWNISVEKGENYLQYLQLCQWTEIGDDTWQTVVSECTVNITENFKSKSLYDQDSLSWWVFQSCQLTHMLVNAVKLVSEGDSEPERPIPVRLLRDRQVKERSQSRKVNLRQIAWHYKKGLVCLELTEQQREYGCLRSK